MINCVVNHSVFLSKMSKFKLLLHGCVWINEENRVLQGSILELQLFSMYINDMYDVGTLMYADDMVLYAYGKDPEQMAAWWDSTDPLGKLFRERLFSVTHSSDIIMYFKSAVERWT